MRTLIHYIEILNINIYVVINKFSIRNSVSNSQISVIGNFTFNVILIVEYI